MRYLRFGAASRGRRTLFCLALLAAPATLVAAPGVAHAQGASNTASNLVDQALESDLSKSANRGRAKQKLAFAESLCSRGCNPEAAAKVAMLRGILKAHEKKDDEARAAFEEALEADPAAELPRQNNTGAPKALWDEVSGSADPAPLPAPPKPPPEPEGDDDDDDDDGPSVSASSDGLPVNITAAAQISGYSDTDSVDVLNPGLLIGVEDPINGWGLNASFYVDVVTAASPDIVATASPGWLDLRFAPALGAHVKVDSVDISLNGSYSQENDHRGITAGIGVAVDTMNKQVTPSIAYSFGYDTAGRTGTPFDVYALNLQRHGLVTGVTLVLDKSTILVPGSTFVLEAGRQEKPYRYLPIFDAQTPIEAGESIESVNSKRLDGRMEERLPDLRFRWALSALLAHRTGDVTVRVSERLYVDTWGQMATTTNFMLPWDITKQIRFWPHLRVHAQSSVGFWKLGYTVEPTSAGTPLALPEFRTGDREMGPLVGVTGGAGIRVLLGDKTPSLTFSGDAIYTRWLDHLYRTERLGGFGLLSLEVEAE